MLPTIDRNFISTQLKIVLAIVAIGGIAGALVPYLVLFPFRNALAASRDPDAAASAIRLICISSAGLSALTVGAWPWIHKRLTAAVRSLAGCSSLVFWGLVCGTLLVLRLPILAIIPPSPLRSDSLWYHSTAISIAQGYGFEQYGEPTAYRAPGYSVLLAIVYRIFGYGAEWAWLLGIISTAILLLSTYGIAKTLYGKVVARIATLTIATYPALVIYTGLPLSDLVFTSGLMFIFLIVVRLPPYRWYITIGVGIALGALTLTRSVAAGLFVIIPLVWFLRSRNSRALLLHSTFLAFSFIACLSPWLIRNYEVFGTPLLGTNMGLLLHMGNHPGASGAADFDAVPDAALDASLILNEAQIDAIYRNAAIDYIIEYPLDAVAIVPRKLVHFYLPEISAAQTLFQDRLSSTKYVLYGFTQLFYLFILVLFVLRVFNLARSGLTPCGIQWLGFIIIAYFTMTTAVFIGQDRYRLPILPFMIIESSVILAGLITPAGGVGTRRHDEIRYTSELR